MTEVCLAVLLHDGVLAWGAKEESITYGVHLAALFYPVFRRLGALVRHSGVLLVDRAWLGLAIRRSMRN